MEQPVVNNPRKYRFEAVIGSHVAVLNYKQESNRITFIHTEVPEELAGRGIGNALAKAGLEYAREQRLQVIPRCRFVAKYIEKHPEFEDLVASAS
jgi:uncharacterized protein